MKNKIQKIVITMMCILAMGTSHSQADEADDFVDDPPSRTYAGRGALIGAISGATFGYLIALSESSSDCNEGLCGLEYPAFTGLGLGIGTIFGAVIGAFIPRKPDFAITPTFNPTPGAVGGGLNFSMKF